MNARYSDMFKAFQFIDLDRSGFVGKQELKRALDLWNVQLDGNKLDDLINEIDVNGDGQISYQEFVDALARDTVASAAMGKRGMQSKEAMGVDAQEFLAHQLGHVKQKRWQPSINEE